MEISLGIILAVVIGLILIGVILILQFGTSSKSPTPPTPVVKDIITFKHILTDPESPSIQIIVSGDGIIEWGDGTTSTFNGTDKFFTHTYNPLISDDYTVIVSGIIYDFAGTNQSDANIANCYDVNVSAPNLTRFTVKLDPNEPCVFTGIENSKNCTTIIIRNAINFTIPNSVTILSLNNSASDRNEISVAGITECNFETLSLVGQVPEELLEPFEGGLDLNLNPYSGLISFNLSYSNGISPPENDIRIVINNNAPLESLTVSFANEKDLTIQTQNGTDFFSSSVFENLTSLNFQNISYISNKDLDFTNCSNLNDLTLLINSTGNDLTLPSSNNIKGLLDLNVTTGTLTIDDFNLNTELEVLSLTNDINFGSSLDLIEIVGLLSLTISNNPNITSLTATGLPELTFVNVNNNTNLDDFGVINNLKLDNIVLSGNNSLTTVNISSNESLTDVDISNNNSLTDVNISSNDSLTDVDISNIASLTTVNISSNNSLTTVNISSNNNLTTVDISNNNNLTGVDILNDNSLTDMNISNNNLDYNTLEEIGNNLLNVSIVGPKTLNVASNPGTNTVITNIANPPWADLATNEWTITTA
jgi:hypothetical protein